MRTADVKFNRLMERAEDALMAMKDVSGELERFAKFYGNRRDVPSFKLFDRMYDRIEGYREDYENDFRKLMDGVMGVQIRERTFDQTDDVMVARRVAREMQLVAGLISKR